MKKECPCGNIGIHCRDCCEIGCGGNTYCKCECHFDSIKSWDGVSVSEKRFYWTKNKDANSWNNFSYLTFIIIPRHWWSIKGWKFAWSLRAEFLERIMTK